jgi:hypothetical protein
MQPAQYRDPAFQGHGFYKHIHTIMVDMGVYAGTNDRLLELYKVILMENLQSTGPSGGRPRNIYLFRKALGPGQDPSTGSWDKIAAWCEGQDYNDASTSGSVSVDLSTGDVHVALVFGKKVDGVLGYRDWEQTVPRATFAPPIVRLDGGAYVPCTPGRYSAAIDGQAISGGRALDMAALFTVPSGCRAYAVRLVAQATAPNVRVRLGTEAQPGEYTINTQVANLQIHQVGVVNADSGARLWLSVVDGAGQNAHAQVWLKVNGYWPG